MNRKFGIEMEIAGINRETALAALGAVNVRVENEDYNHTTRNHWKIVSDSSVREGFEVVSPILTGSAGLAEAEIVARALDDAGASVNSSCGLHVHFDASDLDVNALKNIMRRYAAHEAEIDAFMPASRRGNENTFCKSIRGFVQESLESATSIQNLAARQNSRYYKVNLKSLFRHGTLEFRQHSGTVNAAKITNWVRFLASFIDQCKAMAGNALQANTLPALSGVQAKLASMFRHERTITLARMMEVFGWLDITARAAVTRLRKAGMEIRATKVDSAAVASSTGLRMRRPPCGDGQAAYTLVRDIADSRIDSLWDGIEQAVAMFYQRRVAVFAVAAA